MSGIIQSYAEAERVFIEWLENYAPKDLLHTMENQRQLADYLRLHYAGVVSVTNLNAAVANLNLERKPVKTAQEIDIEFRTRELQRRQREQAENAVPFNHAKGVQEQADKATQQKQQDVAANAIDRAINEYQCTKGPNRLDYGLMDTRKAKLRGIVSANPRMDRIKLLALIRQTILDFPDPYEHSR